MPRHVTAPATRPAGGEWLNGPLVWAIDDWHSPTYLFPRDCPRILWWPLPGTTPADLERYWGLRAGTGMIACIEWIWLEQLRTTTLYRYSLPGDGFIDLQDHGVSVSREAVTPERVEPVPDLVKALQEADV